MLCVLGIAVGASVVAVVVGVYPFHISSAGALGAVSVAVFTFPD